MSCPVFKKCGGCQYLDKPYKEQLALKQRSVKKLLSPWINPDPIIGMENPEHYRNKVHAVFDHGKKGEVFSGVYQEGTHKVLSIESCILEDEKADEIIGTIRKLLPSFKIRTYDEDRGTGLFRHALIRVGKNSGQIMVVLVLADKVFPSKNNFVKALLKVHPEITTIVLNVNDKRTSMILGEQEQVLYGKGYIEDILCDMTFRISSKSFYQINVEQTEKLYKRAVDMAYLTGKEKVIDAYCGIGTIGLVASKNAGEVIGVELNRDAVRDAVFNAKRNHAENITFYNKDAGEFMKELAAQGGKADVVMMDPPRTGASGAFLDALLKLKPNRIVYISCNPETLARDLKRLSCNGYVVKRAVPYDMFPFTEHVETIALLQKINHNSKTNAYVNVGIDAKEYYAIKNADKE